MQMQVLMIVDDMVQLLLGSVFKNSVRVVSLSLRFHVLSLSKGIVMLSQSELGLLNRLGLRLDHLSTDYS